MPGRILSTSFSLRPMSDRPPRAARGPTASARAARDVVRYAAARGAREDALLAAAGISAEALRDPDGRVPGAAHGRLWDAAADQVGDPDLGLHLGARYRHDALSIVGHVMLSARTLGEALDALAEYSTLFAEGVRTRLDRGGAGRPAALEFETVDAGTSYLVGASRHPIECLMASVAAVVEVLTGSPLPVLAVALVHDRPASGAAAHEAVFGVVPTFGAPVARLAFEAAALRWPGTAASPRLFATLTHGADLLLDDLEAARGAGVRPRVAESVASHFRGRVPSLSDVAVDLAMGERTLQRELKAEGTSFQDVVREVRLALACHHLDRPHATIHEVAFLLGYAEPSAFHRAFKRWTGRTPRDYRSRLADAYPGASFEEKG